MVENAFKSIETLKEALETHQYVADRPIATVLFLARALGKPLFLEGEPGVGKTEVALVLSAILGAKLIRLQCYEGLDASMALYEWDYPKQLLRIKLEERGERTPDQLGSLIYSEPYLIKRPLLEAILSSDPEAPVLLIDEIDRADEEFEAFLLEVLSDFQITIPELGTLKAKRRPMVIITSNRTREIHEALKRRCLFHWIDFPTLEKEYRIIRAREPKAGENLARQVAAMMQKIREGDFLKRPGVSETLDWTGALITLHREVLEPEVIEETLGCIFKYQEDIRKFKEEVWSNQEAQSRFLSACRIG
jgi:MoxR-like ATPase